MMNRSKIDWCDFSWNPITGCQHTCEYCYARKQSKRFCGDIRLNKASPQIRKADDLYILDKPFYNVNGKVIPMPVGFEPTLHRYRLSMPQEKKLPANIFVGSMADVFGEWVSDKWIQEVFKACEAAPQHRYLFLTKNPKRYIELSGLGYMPLSKNFWYGYTVTGLEDEPLIYNSVHNSFISIEPILKPISHNWLDKALLHTDWVIIGAESGTRRNKIIPEREWIGNIVEACQANNIPVFMKSSIKELMGDKFIQEYPKGLEALRPPLPKHRVFVKSVRDKKNCKQCGIDLQGKPATRMAARYYLCENCYKGE